MKHETFRFAETDPDQAYAEAVLDEIGAMLRSYGLVVLGVVLLVVGALA